MISVYVDACIGAVALAQNYFINECVGWLKNKKVDEVDGYFYIVY